MPSSAGLRPCRGLATCAGLLLTIASAWAEPSVALGGSMGERALLIIDGTPRTVAPGQTVLGVKLLRMADGEAEVEIDGRRLRLHPGGAPAAVAGGVPARGEGDRIVLTAGLGGHFTTGGTINGRTVEFLVDTGATSVALSQADADRIGLDWRNGRRGLSNTANGVAPMYQLTLSSVRIGEVEVYNVPAVVLTAPMPYVLLGNSFLARFQMRRENDVLTLERRL